VIEAAWRAGAGLDAWFESAERSYAAWTGAIEAAGLGGRYRQLELGAWSAVEAMEAADLAAFCRQPLPWDHIDSGLDKRWLADDLQRALAATVVPDCSFEGCSSCGVCGPELGHNVVIPPPQIPPALPQRPPASERVCRLRMGFAKTGALALISHLDLLRLLERALRRTGLPVSFTGGFHPLPRLQLALPLPLGVEGTGEWLDLEFTEAVDPALVRTRLQPQLPPGLQLLSAAVVPTFGPSLSQELAAARWRFRLLPQAFAPTPERWQVALDALLAAETLVWHDTDKKGRPRQRDCRADLLGLELLALESSGSITLQLQAAIDSAGRSIRPEQVGHWLAERLDGALMLQRVRREALLLKPC
jgi:radical SAM-linked protein